MARPKKDVHKPVRNEFSTANCNKDIYKRTTQDSSVYEDIVVFQGVDPLVKLENFDRRLYRIDKQSDRERITVEQYTHLIYGWLLLNKKMLSVSDFYDYPADNAPFIYSLDEVLDVDSDEIYNLLQERITKMMMRKQIDRESALAVLQQNFGWQRDNEQNINLNTGGVVSFKFGDTLVNGENQTTDENGKDN